MDCGGGKDDGQLFAAINDSAIDEIDECRKLVKCERNIFKLFFFLLVGNKTLLFFIYVKNHNQNVYIVKNFTNISLYVLNEIRGLHGNIFQHQI